MKFKEYTQAQGMLLPHNFDDFIPQNDPVRVINRVVEQIDLSAIIATYKDNGCSAYHPKLLIKIITYAYLRNTYSSRKIEDLTANDIRFMWLAAMQRPDHRTINNFRSSRLKGTLREIFTQVVKLFVEEKMVTLNTMHQTPGDTTTYIEHTQTHKEMYGEYPEESVADAGYGSEENYEYAESKGITPYIKYNYFHKEQKKSWKSDPFKSCNFYYNKDQDCYYCPMGQPMRRLYVTHPKTKTGYVQEVTHYGAVHCDGCPLRCSCHKSKRDRVIQVNHRLNELKAKARERLMSERGLEQRSQRPADVEQTFGNLKWNKKIKRFLLRGIEKVEIEFGLLALAHNLSKLATQRV